jgi:RimJ/RimL family protein N-acetyltransferase
MKTGLLLHCDGQVAEYLFTKHVTPRMKYDQAIGIMTDDQLTGGVLFQCWNGFNVELSYYGTGTLTPGIIKCLARILVSTFNVSRVTVTVSQRSRRLMRALQKLGFVLEGHQRCFYGHKDIRRNTGVRFVMFRERVEQLCQFEQRAAS